MSLWERTAAPPPRASIKVKIKIIAETKSHCNSITASVCPHGTASWTRLSLNPTFKTIDNPLCVIRLWRSMHIVVRLTQMDHTRSLYGNEPQLNKYLPKRTLNIFAPRRANSAASVPNSGGFVGFASNKHLSPIEKDCLRRERHRSALRQLLQHHRGEALCTGPTHPGPTDNHSNTNIRLKTLSKRRSLKVKLK